jgi:arylamine N-acetyltransferase
MTIHDGELSRQLIDCLNRFQVVHAEAEASYLTHAELAGSLNSVKQSVMAEITRETTHDGKPIYSNQEKREAELQRRLTTRFTALVDEEEQTNSDRRMRQAELERVSEELKTLRALVAHETARLELEATETGSLRLLRRAN